MPSSEVPCLSLTIAPLRSAGHFAIHVTKAPYPGGFVLHEGIWSESLTQLWQTWQELFSERVLPSVPLVSHINNPPQDVVLPLDASLSSPGQPVSRAQRLMQNLGVNLWQWLFDGPIQGSLSHSQGIAVGQGNPLRFRLEIRDPDLIALPWEIMQDAVGKQAMSLSQQLLFSRTTSDVSPLPPLRSDHMLKILLVLGQDEIPDQSGQSFGASNLLQLQQEADALAKVLKTSGSSGIGRSITTPCQVDTLVQPTPAELIHHLETQTYNVFFYSGHGVPAPDGGLLFLRPDMTLNGTELAQVLTRCQVKLAVFNACWGAQPDHDELSQGEPSSQAIPRSSLAEVLIHHGVPAVLGMREPITDDEALRFIQAFAKALAERMCIDQAVAVARQHLLILYHFNQPAWTLPVLYMHPEFDGELLTRIEGTPTEMPHTSITQFGEEGMTASLRSLNTARVWHIQGGVMRVGRDRAENELVILEEQAGVSRRHAVIFCRHSQRNGSREITYFLEDFSRFGTWLLDPEMGSDGWQKIHRQEVPLRSGAHLKFGSSQNEPMEFVIQIGN
jgi:hypothetical protein